MKKYPKAMTLDPPTIFEVPQQKITLHHLQSTGLVLDVGGGGEGLVSRIEKKRVCALDVRLEKIRESKIYGSPANWFVGDGQIICFKDSVFQVVTFWFSLGYMTSWDIKRKVMEESLRVLNRGGTLSIKACKIECKEDRFVFKVIHTFPDGTLSQTGYRVRGGQNQTPLTVSRLLEEVGYSNLDIVDNGYWFKITARKPQ